MRVVVRALLVAVAMAGAAAEVWAVRSGWSWVSAALDLLAGWFLATPQAVGGPAGHATLRD